MKEDEGYKQLIKILREEIQELKQYKSECIRFETYYSNVSNYFKRCTETNLLLENFLVRKSKQRKFITRL